MRPRFVKLASFYFFYFAILGAYLPYWPLYLKDLGFAVGEIGELMAITLGTKIIAPYLWGWIGDHTHQRLRIIRLGALLAALSFFLILFGTGYAWIAAVIFLFSFFWNALLPQFEVITLDNLRHQSHHYSRIRLWGSIGFIFAAVTTAPLVEIFGSTIVPWIIAGFLTLLWLSGMHLAARSATGGPPALSLRRALDLPIVTLLMISCLMQLSHGAYYAYFTIFMEAHDYSRTVIGIFWGVGVICEIAVLLAVGTLLQRVSPVLLLALALAATAARWLLIGHLPDHAAAVIGAQVLHAVTFGVYHAAMIYALSCRLPGGLKGRGQALYSSLSFGVGGSLGTYAASLLWEPLGGAIVFTLSAAVGGLALLLLLPLRGLQFNRCPLPHAVPPGGGKQAAKA